MIQNIKDSDIINSVKTFPKVKVTRGPGNATYTFDGNTMTNIDAVPINSIFQFNLATDNIPIITGEAVSANHGDYFTKDGGGRLYKIGWSGYISHFYNQQNDNYNMYKPKVLDAIPVTEDVLQVVCPQSTIQEENCVKKGSKIVLRGRKDTTTVSLEVGDFFVFTENNLNQKFCFMGSGKEFFLCEEPSPPNETSWWGGRRRKSSPKTPSKSAAKAKGPQPSAQRVVVNGQKRVVYLGPKGGKYIKKGGEFVRL